MDIATDDEPAPAYLRAAAQAWAHSTEARRARRRDAILFSIATLIGSAVVFAAGVAAQFQFNLIH